MPAKDLERKPGRPRKGKTATEQAAAALASTISPARRRVSGQDRQFIRHYAETGFKDADLAAKLAGFKEKYIGGKIAGRLGDLIEAERLRLAMQEQMELDEALRLTAQLARTAWRDVDKLQALRTILQVHGVLSDKPLPAIDRRTIARQIAETIDRIQRTASTSPGARVKVRAMVGAAIEASVESSQEQRPDAPANPTRLEVLPASDASALRLTAETRPTSPDIVDASDPERRARS